MHNVPTLPLKYYKLTEAVNCFSFWSLTVYNKNTYEDSVVTVAEICCLFKAGNCNCNQQIIVND